MDVKKQMSFVSDQVHKIMSFFVWALSPQKSASLATHVFPELSVLGGQNFSCPPQLASTIRKPPTAQIMQNLKM